MKGLAQLSKPFLIIGELILNEQVACQFKLAENCIGTLSLY